MPRRGTLQAPFCRKVNDVCKTIAFLVSSFRAKPRNLPCTPVKRRRQDNVKPMIPSDFYVTACMQNTLRRKDPSTALGMTIRENRLSPHSLSFHHAWRMPFPRLVISSEVEKSQYHNGYQPFLIQSRLSNGIKGSRPRGSPKSPIHFPSISKGHPWKKESS